MKNDCQNCRYYNYDIDVMKENDELIAEIELLREQNNILSEALLEANNTYLFADKKFLKAIVALGCIVTYFIILIKLFSIF